MKTFSFLTWARRVSKGDDESEVCAFRDWSGFATVTFENGTFKSESQLAINYQKKKEQKYTGFL
jgi:hypothetical protein